MASELDTDLIMQAKSIDLNAFKGRDKWPAELESNFQLDIGPEWAQRGSPQLAAAELYWFGPEQGSRSPLVEIQRGFMHDMLRKLLLSMYELKLENWEAPVCGFSTAVRVRKDGPFCVRTCFVQLGRSDKSCNRHGSDRGGLKEAFNPDTENAVCSFALEDKPGEFTCPAVLCDVDSPWIECPFDEKYEHSACIRTTLVPYSASAPISRP